MNKTSTYTYKKIGLLGGSFNPAHEGHLYISQKALSLLGLDEVWWILSPHNPLKDKRTLWPYEERRKSITKLIKHQPNIHLSEIESEIHSQYTVNTLQALKERYGSHQFVWLMGEDNLYHFHLWHKWQNISKTMPIAVLARKVDVEPNYQEGLLCAEFRDTRIAQEHAKQLVTQAPPAWVFLSIPHHPLSSTSIRDNEIEL